MSQCPESAEERRFKFGANWRRFLRHLTPQRILEAEQSLRSLLGCDSLQDVRFLDAGSGSGLFSLAARRLGAQVVSFDCDPESVLCTAELKRRYNADDPAWIVGEGSVLDRRYLAALGMFDCVYSWGVLHHTGRMWEALENVSSVVAEGGVLVVAIYNDQGRTSRYWHSVKRVYNSGMLGRTAMVALHFPYLYAARYAFRAFTGRWDVERGMSMWHDMLDWLGGYPFEVATPGEVLAFCRPRGFELEGLKTCGGRLGCNEFVLRKRSLQVDGHRGLA